MDIDFINQRLKRIKNNECTKCGQPLVNGKYDCNCFGGKIK